ncbi:DUF7686 domain-containing protein [Paraburkholderia silvatlantica]|uniref:DUF7686 domain-containing protein n=1 Tax=Paraburkholderia silvatlantica TaxID=321895 RepID=UPI003CC5D78D
MAESTGFTDFENVRLDPIRLIDCHGEPHPFHFQRRLLGDRVVQRMRRALSTRSLRPVQGGRA